MRVKAIDKQILAVCKRLKYVRQKRELTLKQVSHLSGMGGRKTKIGDCTIQKMENGKSRVNVTLTTLFRLLEVYNMSPKKFFSIDIDKIYIKTGWGRDKK